MREMYRNADQYWNYYLNEVLNPDDSIEVIIE